MFLELAIPLVNDFYAIAGLQSGVLCLARLDVFQLVARGRQSAIDAFA